MKADKWVRYGKRKITYSVQRVNRRTLEIAVLPDGRVAVKAPLKAKASKVADKVLKRARWILRQQEYFSKFNPRTPGRTYCPGETHLYLGRPYRLRVHAAKRERLVLGRGTILVETKGESKRGLVRTIMQEWYRAKAYQVFEEVIDKYYPRLGLGKILRPRLHVRRVSKRWGSLAASGTLTLNLDLIRAPRICIEYVVAHELCHLHHPNHGKAFYARLGEMMPDWKIRKERLEKALI
jgi:predicted metal-dependent hydrolase